MAEALEKDTVADREWVAHLEALVEVARAVTGTLDLNRVLSLVVDKSVQAIRAEAVEFLVVDPESGILRPLKAHGLSTEHASAIALAPGEGISGAAMREARPICTENLQADTRFIQSEAGRALLAAAGFQATLSVPILTRSGPYGVLNFHRHHSEPFDPDDVRVATLLAAQAAIAIENARLFQQEQERRRQLDAVRAVTAEITRELNLASLLRRIDERATELVGGSSGAVFLWDEAAQILLPRAWHGLGEWVGQVRLGLGEAIVGIAAERRESMVINEYRASPYAYPLMLEQTKVTAVAAEPLLYHDRLLGVITVNLEGSNRSFGRQDHEMLALFAAQAAIAIENARLYEEIRQARDDLRNLSRRLVEAQEAERQHLARELHDDIGQTLTGLKLRLEKEARLLGAEGGGGRPDALGIVNDLIKHVRNLSLDLRPPVLDDLGLLPALLWQFERFTHQTGVRVGFSHEGLDLRFGPDVETAAYRIVQEALTNAARHADVPEARVRVWADEHTLHVQVEDRGRGFDPTQASPLASGLIGMRERAMLLGGQLSVASQPGGGTRVTARLPLSGAADRGRGSR